MKSLISTYDVIYIIINVLWCALLDAPELMRACDGSLEPSWHKNDGSMENFRFARAARPQCAKMCFLLHKAPLNSCLEGCNANMIVDNLGKLTFPK